MSTVIRVEHLSKQYRLGMIGGATLREDLSRWWALKRGKDDPLATVGTGAGQPARIGERFWALKDVSFEVKQGEILGIIGRNGAGKSTLLKILSRITAPTEGVVKVKGRIGSLLEVGTGFHPELTGRENIYLNGAILGMSRREVDRKLDEIIAFSEVEQFIDTPVKRYSSGMYVRLAFAVAAHLDPEILIVDEVLAVGDAAFQKKCLGKMGDVAGEGRTVLFVSHNMGSVVSLTTRALLLEDGTIAFCSDPGSTIARYLSLRPSGAQAYTAWPRSDQPTITFVDVETSEPGYLQQCGKPMRVIIEVWTTGPVDGARLSFQICSMLDQPLVHMWCYDSERPICRERGLHRFECDLPKLRLYRGRYSLKVHFGEGFGKAKFEVLEGVCPFEVDMGGSNREGGWAADACVYLEEGTWAVSRLDPDSFGTYREVGGLSA